MRQSNLICRWLWETCGWRPFSAHTSSNAVSGRLLPRRFGLKSRMNWLLCPKFPQRETVAATEARLAGAHDVLHIDNSIVMR
jgi:hypothetical protein